VIFSGKVDGKSFHTETTLLAETRTIEWSPGQRVEARVSQYTAYLDGRIEEVALDYYAQADDGSVWYLGEDVYDYDRAGLVDSTHGSWLAGREGPPEMIMPADPKVGDVHRAENIPAIAFEEVEIKTTDKTVGGPAGPVESAMVARELHDDGTYSDKVFAPGYGEFFTGHRGEIEALALAVPTDALEGSPPAELEALSRAGADVVDPARSGNWKEASTGLKTASGLVGLPARTGSPPPRDGNVPRPQGTALRNRRARPGASRHRGDRRCPIGARFRAAIPSARRDRPWSLRAVDEPDARRCSRRRCRGCEGRRHDHGVDP